MWYRHTRNITQPQKRGKTMPFALTQTDLEIVLLSEVSQTEEENVMQYSLSVESKKYSTKRTYLQNKNRVTESKLTVIKGISREEDNLEDWD